MSAAGGQGGSIVLDVLFERHKERLRRTVKLRLDRRLSGQVDSSGVLRLARAEALDRRGELDAGGLDPFLWLRRIVGQVLEELHRDRLGGDCRGDLSLYRGALPEITSGSLAARLLGWSGGPPDQAADRAERLLLLQDVLNAMEPVAREVLALRHFEKLSNDETAAVLGITRARASETYIRALKRVTMILGGSPGPKGKP